jgi:hypothetical protein
MVETIEVRWVAGNSPTFKWIAPLLKDRAYATYAALRNFDICPGESCGSSVVEHSLGKGEAESSILSRSTSK